MNLGEQFRSDVATAAPNDGIRGVVQTMKKCNVGAVVVTEGKKIVGIVTDRDVAMALGTAKAGVDDPVQNIMTRHVRTVWDDQGLFNATQAFLGYKVRRLPIINHDNELVGIVTFDDVLAFLSRELYNISKAVAPALPEEAHVKARESLLPVG